MAHCQTGSLWVSTLFFSPLLPYCWSVSKSLRISCFLSPVVRFLHVVHLACKYGVCGAGLQGIYMYLFIFLKPCAGLSHIHGNQPLQSPFPGWVKLNKTHKTESTWDQLLWCPWITSKEKCGITWLEKTHDLKKFIYPGTSTLEQSTGVGASGCGSAVHNQWLTATLMASQTNTFCNLFFLYFLFFQELQVSSSMKANHFFLASYSCFISHICRCLQVMWSKHWIWLKLNCRNKVKEASEI